ncbi:pyruvate carboxylase subunit B [bacterium]
MENRKKIPIKITDTTLRDAQQSVWARHINPKELKDIIKGLDNAGFHSLEVWGGATFENSLRYWREDPWEHLQNIKKLIKNTPLQMLLRGQNIVGYHHFPDDVLEEFIKNAINHGISIIRIFDALNDIKNVETAINFTKKYKTHAQGTLCYTIDKHYDIDFYINYAKQLAKKGVDSIAIKDTAGILLPDIAVNLIKRLKNAVKLPVQLHSHLTNGSVNVTYFEAIKAGIDVIDCTLGPLSLPAAQPAVENMINVLENTQFVLKINKEKIYDISKELFDICRQKDINKSTIPLNDHTIFSHQVPRGSYMFLHDQLKKRNALDKLPDVLEEIPKVRKELGSPPLFIPLSQIVVAQAVQNVLLSRRYQLMPREVKNYLRGFYGKPRGKIDKNLLDMVKNEGPMITGRPADNLPPMLTEIKEKLDDTLIEHETDYLLYALFPDLALDFFKWRKSPFKTPLPEASAIDTDDVSPEEEVLMVHRLMKEKDVSEFELNEENHYVYIKRFADSDTNGQSITPSAYTKNAPLAQAPVQKQEQEGLEKITSPIVGIFYGQPGPEGPPYVKAGDKVSEGQTVCIVEAMKVMNEIKAPFNCEIVRSVVKNKDSVSPSQTLFHVRKL